MLQLKLCPCGSGKDRFELRDARGIFCSYACDECVAEKRKRYRVEIFRDPAYQADEPIDED